MSTRELLIPGGWWDFVKSPDHMGLAVSGTWSVIEAEVQEVHKGNKNIMYIFFRALENPYFFLSHDGIQKRK